MGRQQNEGNTQFAANYALCVIRNENTDCHASLTADADDITISGVAHSSGEDRCAAPDAEQGNEGHSAFPSFTRGGWVAPHQSGTTYGERIANYADGFLVFDSQFGAVTAAGRLTSRSNRHSDRLRPVGWRDRRERISRRQRCSRRNTGRAIARREAFPGTVEQPPEAGVGTVCRTQCPAS